MRDACVSIQRFAEGKTRADLTVLLEIIHWLMLVVLVVLVHLELLAV